MPHYRLYELTPTGHIIAGHDLDCADDAAALATAAARLAKASGVEVWQAIRYLGRLPGWAIRLE